MAKYGLQNLALMGIPAKYDEFSVPRGLPCSRQGGDDLANRVPRRYHRNANRTREGEMALRKFIIERDIPAAGSLDREQLRGAAAKSNGVLRQLGPDIQWVESYVAADKTFCVYLAKDEAIIKASRRPRLPKCAR